MRLTNKIIKYIEQNKDEDYMEILSNDDSWEIFYHFSPMRSSILAWYEFKDDAKVLELGAELGALTGTLCDKCNYVVSVTENEVCAKAIEKRYKNRNNLRVTFGDIQNLEFKENFDYILLIGQLEVSGKGSKVLERYSYYINCVLKYLKYGGKLIIAVDNRYGSRYQCGIPEKYTNIPFLGVNDYLETKSCGYCFNKEEIEKIIDGSNIKYKKYFYPLPDFYFAQEIYSENNLPQSSIKDRVTNYYLYPEMLVRNEDDLLNEAIKNGNFPEVCNSFFIECSQIDELTNVEYAAVSIDRGKNHSFVTTIGNDSIVRKRAVYEEGINYLRESYHNILHIKEKGIKIVPLEFRNNEIKMPYIRAPKLVDYLAEIVLENREKFISCFDKLYEYILNSSEHISIEMNRLSIDGYTGVVLKEAYIDMIPLNCFYSDDNILFFDQEFSYSCYPADYILFRAIRYSYLTHPEIERSYPIEELKKRYHIKEIWNVFLEEEDRFISEFKNYRYYGQFYKWADKRELDRAEFGIKNYKIKKGFDILESSNGTSWHWAISKTAEIEIFNISVIPQDYQVSFDIDAPFSEGTKTVKIYENDELLYDRMLPYTCKIERRLLPGERRNILFEMVGEYIYSENDTRTLAFRIVNLTVNNTDNVEKFAQIDDSLYTVERGFDIQEVDDEQNSWFWALEKKSRIKIYSNKKNRCYEIDFIIEPPPSGKGRDVSISLDGKMIYRGEAPYRYNFSVFFETEGSRTIDFETQSECLSLGVKDTRMAAYQLINFDIKVSASSYEPTPYHQKLKKIQLELLEKLVMVSNKYNLKCFLIYGSLLGAVRHGGMIPWDDDIDVAFLREDYDKILSIADKEFTGRFFLQTPLNDKNSFYGGYLKLRNNETVALEKKNWGKDCSNGVSIDIFPLDNINIKLWKKQIKKINKYQLIIFAKIYSYKRLELNNISIVKWTCLKAYAFCRKHFELCQKLDCLLRKFQEQNCNYIGIMARYLKKDNYIFYNKTDFLNGIRINYSGLDLWVPQNYTECLTKESGMDYELYPIEAQRHPHHYALWELDISYENLKKNLLFDRNVLKTIKNNIILWGSKAGIDCYFRYYAKIAFPKLIICDEERLCGKIYHGITVQKEYELINEYWNQGLYIVICDKFYFKIVRYLNNIGWKNYIIVEPENYMTIEERGKYNGDV